MFNGACIICSLQYIDSCGSSCWVLKWYPPIHGLFFMAYAWNGNTKTKVATCAKAFPLIPKVKAGLFWCVNAGVSHLWTFEDSLRYIKCLLLQSELLTVSTLGVSGAQWLCAAGSPLRHELYSHRPLAFFTKQFAVGSHGCVLLSAALQKQTLGIV